jgi:TRAP-type mannitol/chloroaromatic compound transport system permease small subunit
MNAIKIYLRIVDTMSEWIGLSVAVLIPCMMIVLTIEVVARYFFQNPTVWVYDMAIFMFGYCGLLAGAYVLKHGGHINVDLIYERLPVRWQAILDVISAFVFFFLIILIIIYGWETAYMALSYGDRTHSSWGPPLGHFKLMIPIGAFLLLLQGVAKWIRDLYKAITLKDLDKELGI